MRIVICGGTGFIGSALKGYWLEKGYQVTIVTRNKTDVTRALEHPALSYVTWEELENNEYPHNEVNAVVNLAGSTINQRWSPAAKADILASRLTATKSVARWVNGLTIKPEVIIQGSAVGIYGTSLEGEFDEESTISSNDFLADVTTQWESTADHEIHGVRLVKLRTGVVLGNNGGAYPLMALPYKIGIGGRIGSGNQWIPWIHLADIVSLIDFCISNRDISGPINAVSPHPVTNNDFGLTLSSVYHRPHWLPLPSLFLRTALGDMSSLLLEGQRVLPSAALRYGFEFTYPTLSSALIDLRRKR
ncbi:TIGR01777 family oxidoreductase [Paenibacillus segetis]|uniref:Epimerase n=1 Tax=Paenibacillus segetis TaxID=1325360 RepID=A0ABQ1Y5L4_9BACL|nr:TIGR01777 family oxidoreductase [Paenibacillus segetis]GGH13257.1 epimerase [Paenibacillus segetis]